MSYMLGNVHVFVERGQPMTRFVDNHVDPPRWFRFNPRRTFPADCCQRRRWAKYLHIQVYYDTVYRFCADGHGCKAEGK